MMDGTVFDIKPYVPFADSHHPEARGGFMGLDEGI